MYEVLDYRSSFNPSCDTQQCSVAKGLNEISGYNSSKQFGIIYSPVDHRQYSSFQHLRNTSAQLNKTTIG